MELFLVVNHFEARGGVYVLYPRKALSVLCNSKLTD